MTFHVVDSELYKRLLTYVLSESQLIDNSFPRTNPDLRDEVVIKRSERDLLNPQSSDGEHKQSLIKFYLFVSWAIKPKLVCWDIKIYEIFVLFCS